MPATDPQVVELTKIASGTPYPPDAFVFVQRGLDFTVRTIHGELDEAAEAELESGRDIPSRHITGAQLCDGLRRFALQEYGLLARTVLRRWNVLRCEDFGQIVFTMVEAGIMHKTHDDRIEDFQGIFDFGSAFTGDLLIQEAT